MKLEKAQEIGNTDVKDIGAAAVDKISNSKKLQNLKKAAVICVGAAALSFGQGAINPDSASANVPLWGEYADTTEQVTIVDQSQEQAGATKDDFIKFLQGNTNSEKRDSLVQTLAGVENKKIAE